MDILLRNIDKDIVNELNSIAKKEGISRNDLLKEYLEVLAVNKQYKNKNDELDYAIKKVATAFEFTHERLESLENNFENILLLIALSAGIDINEIPIIIDNYKKESEGE